MADVSVSLSSASAAERLSVAAGLLSLGSTQMGCSISDLERSDIALEELLDVLEAYGPLSNVTLHLGADGIQMTLRFEAEEQQPDFPQGSRQVIDAGLDRWTLNFPVVSIGLVSSNPSSHAHG